MHFLRYHCDIIVTVILFHLCAHFSCRAQYNEVKLGDYTSVALAADILRTTPHDYQSLLLTPSTNWIFALDEKNVGVTQQW
eukprot:COSAG02_NODE_5537_length_4246_cov_3.395225_2_plen_81_part_00